MKRHKLQGIYRKIPYLSKEELLDLLERTSRTYEKMLKLHGKLYDKQLHPPLREQGETQEKLSRKCVMTALSLRVLKKVIRRIRYWYGKRRAMECPAFLKKKKLYEVKCLLYSPQEAFPFYGYLFSSRDLFENFCSYCSLSYEEILKKVRWKVILNSD